MIIFIKLYITHQVCEFNKVTGEYGCWRGGGREEFLFFTYYYFDIVLNVSFLGII